MIKRFLDSVQKNRQVGYTIAFYREDILIPHHVAIVMDGNRRWAQSKGFLTKVGYEDGAERLMPTVRYAAKMGVKIVTLFAFSTENWARSPKEIQILLYLFEKKLRETLPHLLEHGVAFHTIGRLDRFSASLQKLVEEVKEKTKDGKTIDLVVALDYGGQDEIVRAVAAFSGDLLKGKATLGCLNEQIFAQYLESAPWGSPDLVIRTGGQKRLSNFLLWQLAYSELYFTETLWPDFVEEDFQKALDDYSLRKRRYGK